MANESIESRKLLIVLGSMGRGGAERVISHISNYLAEKGWQIWIAVLLSGKVGYQLHPNVQIVDLSGATQSRIKRLPYWFSSLRKLTAQVQPDSILSFAARINVIVQMACLGQNKKIIVSERNDPYMDGRSKLVDLLTSLLYPRAKAVVFQTKRAASYFSMLKLQNSVIIPNPVFIQHGKKAEHKGKIVTVGRLTQQKNQQMLIDAFAEIKKRFPYAELHIFGEGEFREALTSKAKALGLSGCVFLPGNLKDVHVHIADAGIFVLPSDYEGLSNALLEAMAIGLPCISTRCAGAEDCIVHGESGLLVDVGDKDGLTQAMVRMLEDDAFRAACGARAEQAAKAFSADVILPQWENIIWNPQN